MSDATLVLFYFIVVFFGFFMGASFAFRKSSKDLLDSSETVKTLADYSLRSIYVLHHRQATEEEVHWIATGEDPPEWVAEMLERGEKPWD